MRRNGSTTTGTTVGRGRRRRVAAVVATVTAALGMAAATVAAAPVGGSAGAEAVAATPAPASATVTVTPADELVDGQAVSVGTTGLTPQVFAYQCGVAPQDFQDCDGTTGEAPLEAGPDGSASGERRLFAVIHTERRGAIDCRVAGHCVVAASAYTGADPVEGGVTTPVTFDADAPLLPAPAITVTPSSGLLDGQAVRVDGRDLGHRGATGVQVLQCGPQPSFDACRSLTDPGSEPPEPDPEGRITIETRVWQAFTTDNGDDVDCRTSTDPCLLVVTTRPWETLEAPWAARVTLDFDAGAPPAPAPTLDVSPAADLGDVTELTVRGRNFTPGATVRVSVCDAGTAELCDHATHELPSPNATGAFELRMNAFATFAAGWDEDVPVDCRISGCAVVAEDQASQRRVVAPLAFGPPDPPRGRYLDPVFDEVEVESEIVYRQATDHLGNQVDLRLDVYQPAGDTATSRPAIIWMHGGWFKGGDGGGAMRDHAEASARRGYVAVDVGYRVRPEMDPNDHAELYAAMVDAYEDATAAVDWVRAHAADYRIDGDAVMAGGFSAGAVTSTNLAYMPGQLGPDTSGIAAAIPLEGWFVRTDEPGLPALGPYAVPDPGEPPAIVFHGTADQLMPWGSPADTCLLAAEVGITCEYVAYEGGTHGTVSARVREVMHRTTRFVVDEVLGPQGYFDLAVDAGGAYEVVEGSLVTLAGSASGEGVSYAWSPADRLTDPTAATARYEGHDDGTETLSLSATNSHGIAGADSAEVTTVNAPPVLDDVDVSVAPGDRSVRLTTALTDPGLADTHEAEVDWGDGTVETLTVVQEAGSARLTGGHTYASPGARSVTVRVVDDDGGADSWTGTVDDPACTIDGTSGADVLRGTSGDDVICALGGTDIVIAGAGDDVIVAGDGNDLVIAGAGDDTVDAGDGNDLVIAGNGDDRLDGGPGRDGAHGGPGDDRCEGSERWWSCQPAVRARRSSG